MDDLLKRAMASEKKIAAGEQNILDQETVDEIVGHDFAPKKRDFGLHFHDSVRLMLWVHQSNWQNECMAYWHAPRVTENETHITAIGEPSTFSLSQARDIAIDEEALDYIDSFDDLHEEDCKRWRVASGAKVYTTADWAEAPIVDLAGRNGPPWVAGSRSDMEASSAMFAAVFAEKLWPRMFFARTADEQMRAFRQAFVETVEAP